MATVTAFQAKTRFGEMLDRVVRGEEIVITRLHCFQVALQGPMDALIDHQDVLFACLAFFYTDTLTRFDFSLTVEKTRY